MGDSVEKISALIEKDMIPKVLAAHSADKDALANIIKTANACEATLKQEKTTATKQQAAYITSSKSHKSCRSLESTLYTENANCHTNYIAAKNVKELKCKAYLAISKKFGETSANKQIVTKAGSEDVESYIRRITMTFCGKPLNCPKCKTDSVDPRGGGFLDIFLKHKVECEEATKKFNTISQQCKDLDKKWVTQRKTCDNIQDSMDAASCKWAVEIKDACEAYSGCWTAQKLQLAKARTRVESEVTDRKAEWRGLKRMGCLITAFADKTVTSTEIDACKAKNHTTTHLDIIYPVMPDMASCVVPSLYPNTAEYKKAEFAPLPALAKGKMDANGCTGLKEISTTPAAGSPSGCKCQRATMNGPWSPGGLVQCTNCLDVFKSLDKNSCPIGTKLFSPRSRQDWETFLKSAKSLRAPHWIVDITRPFPGCVVCGSDNSLDSMNSQSREDKKLPLSQRWVTSDGSPWWLRSSAYSEPSGDYAANCFMNLQTFTSADGVTFNDEKCNYHSKSYYCQPLKFSLTPKAGSPTACHCKKVELTGAYSAQILIKCEKCLDVYRSKDKNSCPSGTKLFSPRTRADWKTFLASAQPLRSPNWIVDVTRPQNGCGGCTSHAMSSTTAPQATWVTSDGSPWWFRSSTYSQPNGDYTANCYLDLWQNPSSENAITFDDDNCNYHSRSYYCQSLKTTTTTTTTTPTTTTKTTTTLPTVAFTTNGDIFKFTVDVKFNKWDGENYPHVFKSSAGAFQFHGMGPAYGGNKGKLAFYMITKTNVGAHGRGGGDVMSATTLTQGKWVKVTVEKTVDKLCMTLDSGTPNCVSKSVTAAQFSMKAVGTVTWAMGSNIEGKNFALVKSEEYRLRLTRPLSAGTNNDLHHLHIREIKAFADIAKTKQITLKEKGASTYVLTGSGGAGYKLAIDGKLDKITHSDYGAGKYGKEDHWMEFTSDLPIRTVDIFNRVDQGNPNCCRNRLKGSKVEIWRGTKKVFDYTVPDVKEEYIIPVPEENSSVWKLLYDCHFCPENNGSWQSKPNQAACETRCNGEGTGWYTWKQKTTNCRCDKTCNSKRKYGNCDGKVMIKGAR